MHMWSFLPFVPCIINRRGKGKEPCIDVRRRLIRKKQAPPVSPYTGGALPGGIGSIHFYFSAFNFSFNFRTPGRTAQKYTISQITINSTAKITVKVITPSLGTHPFNR